MMVLECCFLGVLWPLSAVVMENCDLGMQSQFDYLMLLIVITSSFFDVVPLSNPQSQKDMDRLFLGIYLCEFCFKIVALGAFVGRKAYFLDGCVLTCEHVSMRTSMPSCAYMGVHFHAHAHICVCVFVSVCCACAHVSMRL